MTAETITIRPAREGDLSNLSKLIREHARYEQAGALRPDLETALRAMLFSSAPRLRVLLAVRGDALVGYTSWSMEVSTASTSETPNAAVEPAEN